MSDRQTVMSPVFLAHGAPTLAVRDTPASRFLKTFGQGLARPRFILILSAHWETEGLKISAPGPLRTYHDFRGFPAELYDISYPAMAEETGVQEVLSVLTAAGISAELDGDWGLDHGAWVPLSLAFPKAEVPIVAISLPQNSTPASVYALGAAVAPLTRKGVLVAGSGSTTHNLRAIGPDGGDVPGWALGFDAWLENGLKSGSMDYFQDLDAAPDFRQNHPTEEHLLPLFFPFGAAGAGAGYDLLHRSYEYGSISMSYYRFA